MTEYKDIPALLHEADLLGIDWNSSLASARLLFGCLRRSLDGTSLDEPVELLLEGVDQIGAYYAARNRSASFGVSRWRSNP